MSMTDTELRKKILQELNEEYETFLKRSQTLNAFIDTPEFEQLTIDEQTLINRHSEIGCDYHDILDTRARDTRMRLESEGGSQ